MMRKIIPLILLLVATAAVGQATPLTVFDQNGNRTTLTVTSPTLTVPSATGVITPGHAAVYADSNGTLLDGSFSGAQVLPGTLTWATIKNHLGGPRYPPCGIGNAESPCAFSGYGNLTYTLPLNQIGWMFSTSGARGPGGNGDTPKDGLKIVFPTFSSMTAAGYTPLSQDGFASWSTIMGAPGTQFAQVCMNDYADTNPGKFTSLYQQAWDMFYGCVRSPQLNSAVANFSYNGTSILYTGGTANWGEFFGMGQLFAHGQARLFVVKTDPSWNTGPTMVGAAALCQDNGQGLIENANNDTWQLSLLTQNCTIHRAATSSSTAELLVAENNPSGGPISSIQQGAAYSACNALPCADGSRLTHAAGNYVEVCTSSSFPAYESGSVVTINNAPPTLGSIFNDTYIGVSITSQCIELHQLVTPQGLGPPSVWVNGDTLAKSGQPGVVYNELHTSSIATPHATDPMGFEIEGAAHPRTIVGVAYHDTSGAYLDDPCNRNVGSWYGRRHRDITCAYTTAHTITSTTNYVEPSGGSEIRASFVYVGAQANQTQFGAVGDSIPWAITATASNDSLGANRPLINAAGTVYAPGDTVTLAGGTSTIPAVLTVATTTVVSATVAAGGASCAGSGAKTVTGTTGTGTKFTASVNVSGGAITAVNSITNGGSYTVNPTTLSAEPVTGDSCVGSQLSVVMGALSAVATTRGAYSIAPSNPVSQASTSGSGAGATWNITFDQDACNVALAVDTFTVADGSTTQPVGIITGRSTVTIEGMLAGLTEGRHQLSAIWKAPDGGTCTAGSGTRITANSMQ